MAVSSRLPLGTDLAPTCHENHMTLFQTSTSFCVSLLAKSMAGKCIGADMLIAKAAEGGFGPLFLGLFVMLCDGCVASTSDQVGYCHGLCSLDVCVTRLCWKMLAVLARHIDQTNSCCSIDTNQCWLTSSDPCDRWARVAAALAEVSSRILIRMRRRATQD